MALQNAVNATVAYGKETTFGVAAAAASGKYLRRSQTSLALTKDAINSGEARPDAQVADMRHGMRKGGGSIDGELSNQSYDDWLESLLRGTWTAGVSLSNTQLTSVTASIAGSSFTFGGGDPVALGLRLGQVIRFGTVNAAIDGKNYRITSFGGTSNRTVTVTPAPGIDVATADTTFTVAVQGKTLQPGILKDSYTIEQNYGEIDVSELFTGVRIGGCKIGMAPNGPATVSWDLVGKDGNPLSGANAPYFTTVAAAPTTPVLAGISGSMRAMGAERAVVTGANLAIDNGLSSSPVLGAKVAPDVFYAKMKITGDISVYIEDATFLQGFSDETEMDIVIQLEAPLVAGAVAPEFIVFNLQRVKASGASKSLGTDGGLILQMPFQSLLATAGSGKDATSITIQRSNP